MLDFVEQYGQFDTRSREDVEGQNHIGEQEVVVRKISHQSLHVALLKYFPTSICGLQFPLPSLTLASNILGPHRCNRRSRRTHPPSTPQLIFSANPRNLPRPRRLPPCSPRASIQVPNLSAQTSTPSFLSSQFYQFAI